MYSQVVAANPMLATMQVSMAAVGCLLVYLVLFTTRDILLRSHSFLYQLSAIVLVALLPVVGFLLYLLIRPPTTCFERRLERELKEVLRRTAPGQAKPVHNHQKKNHQHQKPHFKPKPLQP